MAKTLDRKAHFASLHPPTDGKHFEQDGVFFDAEGNERGSAISKSAAKRLAAQAPVTPVADAQLSAQLA